eukprot:COSAG01_NODE_961_length_12415_cov_11.715086_2_plen_186_part_00
MNGLGEVTWERLGEWEKPAWVALGYTPERFNAAKGPLDRSWAQLTEQQREAALLLGCDEQGWGEAVAEEKLAVLERARAEAIPPQEDPGDAIDAWLTEVAEMVGRGGENAKERRQRQAVEAKKERKHQAELQQLASWTTDNDGRHTTWLQDVQTERDRVAEHDLDWGRIGTLLRRENFISAAPSS